MSADAKVVEAIVRSLTAVFATLDAEVLTKSQEWAKGRVQALQDFKKSDEYQSIRRNSFASYDKLFAICGGKTWYNVFNCSNPDQVEAFVARNCAAMIASRNARIAKKLEQAGVKELISSRFASTRDGLDGIFVVGTDAGTKSVTVSTVYAGGYNIQCLHLRVLVHVRAIKPAGGAA